MEPGTFQTRLARLFGQRLRRHAGVEELDRAVILFQWVGDASRPIQFSKQGQNDILKENFASFASSHKSAWEYRFYESAAGKRALYEERQKKKEELLKEEQEAKKKHDEQLAAIKKAALLAEEQLEVNIETQALARTLVNAEAQQKLQSILGTGTTVGSVMSAIGSAAKDIFSFL